MNYLKWFIKGYFEVLIGFGLGLLIFYGLEFIF